MRKILVILFALFALAACKNQSVKYEESNSPVDSGQVQESPKVGSEEAAPKMDSGDKKAEDSNSAEEVKTEELPKTDELPKT